MTLNKLPDDDSTSHADNTILAGQSTQPLMSVHPTPGFRHGRRRQIHVAWLVMSIIACIVVSLFAIGIVSLVIPRTQAKLAIGTLLYFYHTPNTGSIYPTYV